MCFRSYACIVHYMYEASGDVEGRHHKTVRRFVVPLACCAVLQKRRKMIWLGPFEWYHTETHLPWTSSEQYWTLRQVSLKLFSLHMFTFVTFAHFAAANFKCIKQNMFPLNRTWRWLSAYFDYIIHLPLLPALTVTLTTYFIHYLYCGALVNSIFVWILKKFMFISWDSHTQSKINCYALIFLLKMRL